MLVPAIAGVLPRQAPAQEHEAQVPLWAFIFMTLFSVVSMGFVAFLLWRPDIYRAVRGPQMEGTEEDPKPLQRASGSRASSLRRPWFRPGGSLRSNINRWRNGVNRDESSSLTESYIVDGHLDEPAAYNYAPPHARPVSSLQRIPEGYEQYVPDSVSSSDAKKP